MKSSNLTTNYYWSFNFTSLDKGLIIFGILPHEYESNKYNINNLFNIYTNIEEGNMKWSIDFKLHTFSFNKKQKNFCSKYNLRRGI